MEFDNYSIIVEFVDEYSIDILYGFINYIKDLLNFRDISFVNSDAISINGINTLDESETIINKLKNLYLPDFKIYGYKSFNILHVTCEVVASYEATVKELRAKDNTIRQQKDIIAKLEQRNRDGYISELEDKVKGLEAANEKLLARNRVRNCVISLSSELNTKIANQSKEITRLLRNQEKLKAEVANDEKIISDLNATRAMLFRKVEELNEGIRNSEDLTWKEKYDNLKKETDDAIRALQTGRTRDDYISELENKAAKLEGKNEELKVINQTWVKEAEKYRRKLMVAERQSKAEETLSKIHSLIHGNEHL